MDTEQVLQDMLTENTGRALCDSGGAYGRHWEQNQGRTFADGLEATLSGSYGYLDVTLSVFHFLNDRLEYNAELQAQYDSHVEGSEDHHLADMESFISHLSESESLTGFYGEGEPMTVNTYNGEDLLSQTIQYILWEDSNGSHALVQIHGGCDVRGGYTSPKAFDLCGSDGTELFDNARASVYCNGEDQDDRQLNLETGAADEPCEFGLDLDNGELMDYDCNSVALHLVDRDADAEDQEDPPEAPRWGSVVRVEYDSEGIYCPNCGSKLHAGPHPC